MQEHLPLLLSSASSLETLNIWLTITLKPGFYEAWTSWANPNLFCYLYIAQCVASFAVASYIITFFDHLTAHIPVSQCMKTNHSNPCIHVATRIAISEGVSMGTAIS